MIIAVHTTHPPTHPPTGNSTSTRNNGPSGLKFCMRPHLTKLTTTQHNFNPTNYWGGGSQTLPPGLTLPIFLGRGATSIELNCVWLLLVLLGEVAYKISDH